MLSVARLAGIMGAKRTPDLIPLCHPLNLSSVQVDLELSATRPAVEITATCKLTAKTGVEMEALTAVAIADLTVLLEAMSSSGIAHLEQASQFFALATQ